MALTTINTWTDPTIIGAIDNMSATEFNEQLKQNMLYLKNRPFDQYLSDGDASWNTTSTVPVLIDSNVMRVEIETISGDVMISCNLITSNNNDGQSMYLGIQIDDDYMYGDVPAGTKTLHVQSHRIVVNSEVVRYNFQVPLFGLTAGTHSAAPMIWATAGTSTWWGNDLNEFSIREI